MSSIICPECGFVNLSAEECKRCHVKFHRPELIPNTSSSGSEDPREPTRQGTQKATLPPLSEYFHAEPASFSAPVIIFAVLLFITVVAVVYELWSYFWFIGSNTWHSMTNPGGASFSYTPVLEPLLYLNFIIKSALLIAALTLLMLLSEKSYSFIKWVRSYLLANLLYQAFELVALLSLRASLPGKDTIEPFNLLFDYRVWIAYALLDFVAISLTLIWYAYFNRSERVKKIFIN
jgi:hypothetical protein